MIGLQLFTLDIPDHGRQFVMISSDLWQHNACVTIDPAELRSVLLLSTYQYHPYLKTRTGGRIGICSLSKSKKRIGSLVCLSFAFEIWTIPHFSNNRISWSYLPPDTTIGCLIMFGYSGLPSRLHGHTPASHAVTLESAGIVFLIGYVMKGIHLGM